MTLETVPFRGVLLTGCMVWATAERSQGAREIRGLERSMAAVSFGTLLGFGRDFSPPPLRLRRRLLLLLEMTWPSHSSQPLSLSLSLSGFWVRNSFFPLDV